MRNRKALQKIMIVFAVLMIVGMLLFTLVPFFS